MRQLQKEKVRGSIAGVLGSAVCALVLLLFAQGTAARQDPHEALNADDPDHGMIYAYGEPGLSHLADVYGTSVNYDVDLHLQLRSGTKLLVQDDTRRIS